MITYEENYGEDADGNRGIKKTCAELESSDEAEIREQIRAQYEPGVEDYIIYMTDSCENEYEFEVNIEDYFTYDEIKEL